jgi:hypothetical protein
VAAGHAALGQVPQGLARDRAAAQPHHAALRAAHRHQPVGQRPQAGGHLPAGPGEGIGDQLGQDAPPAAPVLAGGDLASAAAAEAGGNAAAAGAGRLAGGVQARQRGQGAAAGADAGAQPGLQVAVRADPPLRPAGAAGVALAAARTRREPGRIGLAPARRRGILRHPASATHSPRAQSPRQPAVPSGRYSASNLSRSTSSGTGLYRAILGSRRYVSL